MSRGLLGLTYRRLPLTFVTIAYLVRRSNRDLISGLSFGIFIGILGDARPEYPRPAPGLSGSWPGLQVSSRQPDQQQHGNTDQGSEDEEGRIADGLDHGA